MDTGEKVLIGIVIFLALLLVGSIIWVSIFLVDLIKNPKTSDNKDNKDKNNNENFGFPILGGGYRCRDCTEYPLDMLPNSLYSRTRGDRL